MDLGMEQYWQHIPQHHRRMLGFLTAAILLHGFVLFVLQESGYGARPQLPDWVNIKLIAGIDEPAPEALETKPQIMRPKPKPVETKTREPEQSVTDASELQQAAEAQHYVKADSRPYEHENPKPFYPAAARRRGMQGLVLLQVEVNIRGKVSNVDLKKSSGYRLLDEVAVATVKKWKFIPATKNNDVVVSVIDVPIRFELKDK